MTDPDQREQLSPPTQGRPNSRATILLAGSGVVLATALATLASIGGSSHNTASTANHGSAPTPANIIVDTTGVSDPVDTDTVTTPAMTPSSTTDTTTTTTTGRKKVVVTTTRGSDGHVTTITTETELPPPPVTTTTKKSPPPTTTTTTEPPTTTTTTTTTTQSGSGSNNKP